MLIWPLRRAHEKDIKRLFKWASAGHDNTLNQRIKPGLIIIFNQVNNLDEAYLDGDYATQNLLGDIQLSAAFDEQRALWRRRGKTIRTAKDLILCYYDSFRVISIPSFHGATEARIITQQINLLYKEIREASDRLHQKKLDLDAALDFDTFTDCVHQAYERLADDLSAWIDFYYLNSNQLASFSGFKQHVITPILKSLKQMDYEFSDDIGQEREIVARLMPYIASCVALQLPVSQGHEGT